MNSVTPKSAPQTSSQSPRFGMVVDINRCVGCQTCTISCKHANDTPPGMQWRKVLDVERGEFPDVERLFLVVGCQHCAVPSCVPVCPTGATAQRADGLVTMDYDLCIGCGYCAVACPYQARTIVHDKDWYYGKPTVQEEQTYHDERLGVANKCTFCVERIDEAASIGATPGVDLEHTPACASSCISQAIRFGDFADPDSIVSKLAADNNYFQMHAELGNDPQIKYLYEVPGATPGRDPAPHDLSDEVMSDPENPLVGARQNFWDYRAAMNFILGGMTSGLVIIAYLAHLVGLLPASTLPLLNVMAAVGMAVGLFFVFLEIGRKLRFLKVLLRPQSSWMTRETYFVALFFPIVAADFLWPQGLLHLLAALTAAGFLYSQARILQAGKGIPAWRHPRIPMMLVATGLFEGVGLLALITLIDPPLFAIGKPLAAAGIVLALINGALWRGYMNSAKAECIGPLARSVLSHLTPMLHMVGHLIPVLLLAIAWLWGGGPTVGLTALAGAAAVMGGVMWKYAIITRACHQQGFAVPKMPQRGSGNRAAPARLNAI